MFLFYFSVFLPLAWRKERKKKRWENELGKHKKKKNCSNSDASLKLKSAFLNGVISEK